MKLNTLSRHRVIVEEDGIKWGRKEYFDYTKVRSGQKITTRPMVLYLGTWHRTLKSGNTKNYWCAVDLNNLDTEQLTSLKYHLPEILAKKSVYNRYWTGKRLMPDVFRRWYRTYRVENIGSRIKGRIFALDVKDIDKDKAIEIATKAGDDFSSADKGKQSDYLSQAVIKRGKEEEEQQELVAKERESNDVPTPPSAKHEIIRPKIKEFKPIERLGDTKETEPEIIEPDESGEYDKDRP